MMGLTAKLGLTIGLALMAVGSANAQDNLETGKSAAQLFMSDCAICHKSPQGLAKGGGLSGVQSFLREHYTTSKESAAAMAAYLESADKGGGPAPRNAPAKRTGKPAAKRSGESAAEKSSAGKSSEPKAEEKKPAEEKSESKPAEAPKTEKSE